MNGRWKVADDTFQGKAGNVKEGGDFRSGMRSPMPGFPSVLQKKYKRRHVRHTTETASRSWLEGDAVKFNCLLTCADPTAQSNRDSG